MKIKQVVRFMQDGPSPGIGLGSVVLCDDGSLWYRVWDEIVVGPAWVKIEVDMPAPVEEPTPVAVRQSRRRQVINTTARVEPAAEPADETY